MLGSIMYITPTSLLCYLQEPELQHLLVESRLIESQYSHYFDWIIVNDDLSVGHTHTRTHTHTHHCQEMFGLVLAQL